MSDRSEQTNAPPTYRDEVRDIVVKSGLSGIAATVLAVTISSPAGLGGLIGSSLASGHTPDSAETADALSNLSRYPSPITEVELREIRVQLRQTAQALNDARAETNAEIAHIRSIAASNHILGVAPMAEVAQVGAGMSVTPAEPVEQAAAAAPIRLAEAVRAQPIESPAPGFMQISVEYEAPQAQLSSMALSYGGGEEFGGKPRDPNMELAALLFNY